MSNTAESIRDFLLETKVGAKAVEAFDRLRADERRADAEALARLQKELEKAGRPAWEALTKQEARVEEARGALNAAVAELGRLELERSRVNDVATREILRLEQKLAESSPAELEGFISELNDRRPKLASLDFDYFEERLVPTGRGSMGGYELKRTLFSRLPSVRRAQEVIDEVVVEAATLRFQALDTEALTKRLAGLRARVDAAVDAITSERITGGEAA